jgi:hypothetical protein
MVKSSIQCIQLIIKSKDRLINSSTILHAVIYYFRRQTDHTHSSESLRFSIGHVQL